jgi:hypothetical protein
MPTTIAPRQMYWLKVAAAALLLGGLAVVAGAQLAPDRSLLSTLGFSAAAFVAVVAAIAVAALVIGTVMQWVLRHGGTDTQWFWFPSDPRGLEQLRHPKDHKPSAAPGANRD